MRPLTAASALGASCARYCAGRSRSDDRRRLPRVAAPLSPRVFVNGRRVESVADEPALRPASTRVGVTYDFALRAELAPLMTARQGTTGKTVNRMLHIDETSTDLLYKLEAVRLVCQETGCAQRYLTHDAFNGIFQATKRYRRRARHRLSPALPRLSARSPGRGPDARHRHDGRQGRPLASARASRRTPTVYVHIEGARAGRHRHPRHQGDRHRRALHARVPRHAVPQHERGGCGFRGLLRRAGRCAGRDHRRAARPGARARRRRSSPRNTASRPAS